MQPEKVSDSWMFPVDTFFLNLFFDWDLKVNGFCEILDSRLLKGDSFLDSQFPTCLLLETGRVFQIDQLILMFFFCLGNPSLFHGRASVLPAPRFVFPAFRTFAGFLPKHSTVNPQ